MADLQIGHNLGFAAVTVGNIDRNTNVNGAATSASAGLDMDNMDNITTLKARLQTIDATKYTDRILNQMTLNDLQFAVRTEDFASTIKQ